MTAAHLALILFAGIALGLSGVIVWNGVEGSQACRERGGDYIRTSSGLVCGKIERI